MGEGRTIVPYHDLLATVIGSLQEENYKIDPFLTNLSRDIIAVEGTIKTISPRVNILNYFINKADLPSLDFDFSNISDDHKAELNGLIAMELLKFSDSTSRSSAKTAQTLDMLQKGKIRLRSDFGLEEKVLASIERMVGYAIRAFLVIALFIGSCLLCTVPIDAMETTPFIVASPL